MGRRGGWLLAMAAVLVAAQGTASFGAAVQTPPQTAPPTTRSLLEQLLVPTTTVPAAVEPPPPTPVPPPPEVAPIPEESPTTTVAEPTCPDTPQLAAGGGGGGSEPRTTAPLVEALGIADGSGATAEAALAGMGRFPVGGMAEYADDWGDPRFTPCPHPHRGTDIFAARGTPVRAPVEGVVRFTEEAVGGRSAYVTEADGTDYYMAHLNSFAVLAPGTRVGVGQVVGFVGSSGNAAGGVAHVHLQIHPGGGAPVNPKPMLDLWLDEALGELARRATPEHLLPRPVSAIGVLRRFDVGFREGPLAEARARAQEMARALLDPLTPPAIVALLGPRA